LLYHRVTELSSDPQLLCVSQQNFAQHLQVIREHDRAIQIRALGQALQSANRGQCAVLVTFDDGYADNLYNAKPLLEQYDVPATVFVTTGYLGSKREFWYDDLERILLHNRPLPDILRLRVREHYQEWQVGSVPDGAQSGDPSHNGWNISRADDPTVRHRLYRSIFHMLFPLPDEERQNVLEYLASWAGMDTSQRPTHRTLSANELVRLADGGLIEIGAHTVTHPVLAAVPLGIQKEEISQSKTHLEKVLGCHVTSFAYPFGGRSHYTEETVAAVRESGFKSACSTSAGIVCRGTDRWQLPRFVVRDWDGDQFAHHLEEWINA
jgi:peptidoglycan/xylan/chitin deacetylase (PgdA/CDA1 family)